MATVAYERDTGRSGGGTGRVVRIIGPVLDVEFAPDELPAINNALTVERTLRQHHHHLRGRPAHRRRDRAGHRQRRHRRPGQGPR